MNRSLKFLATWFNPNLLALLISSTLFTGFLPWLVGKKRKGGGTVSSVFITLLMIYLYSNKIIIAWDGMILLIFVSLIVGFFTIVLGEKFLRDNWGKRQRHTGEIVDHDFNETTIDEVHGMLIAIWPIYWFDTFTSSQFITLQIIALIFFDSLTVLSLGQLTRLKKMKKL